MISDHLKLRHIVGAMRMSELSNEQAAQLLASFEPQLLAETLVDCVTRGEARQLFCDEDGYVDGEPPNVEQFKTHGDPTLRPKA